MTRQYSVVSTGQQTPPSSSASLTADTYIEKTWGKEGKDVRVYRLRSQLGGLAGLLGGVTSFLEDPLGTVSLLASTSASTPAPLTQDMEVISIANCLK